MDKYIFLLLIFFAGCTTIQEVGMTEWDYKALKDGYNMECRCCGDTPACKWVSVNGTATTNY